MPWKPKYEGEFPTLGWYALEWISDNLAQPDCTDYFPLQLTPEQAKFVIWYYRIDPITGRRRYRRAVWSRPKGHGKSPLMSAIAALESLADVVPDGWDRAGRPVGRPWSSLRTPLVQLAAVSEDQTANAYGPLLEMLREGPVLDNYSIEPMETFVALPKGRIEFITSAARSREGNRPIFVGLDQTEGWVQSNGGVNLAAVIRRNLGKVGGSSIETPNAFLPGEGSVAEQSAAYAASIIEGHEKDDALFYDHREAPADTDLSDRDSLMVGLKYVYGDSALSAGGWVDLERIVAEIWDPATDPQDARRFYLNQITHASDAWVTSPEWKACYAEDAIVADRDVITLGFDGSRGRVKGKADATALIGCRVRDGHLFELGERSVWEKSRHDPQDWRPPLAEIDAAVRLAFQKYTVVGFYADPSGWTEHVAKWEARYGSRLKVKATIREPISAWPRGKAANAIEAVKTLGSAIENGVCTHDGSSALTRHVLNARRRQNRGGYLLYKAFPDSPDKIDAAYAAVMAWQARLDAVSAGVTKRQKRVISRVRGGVLG
jgi:phage terminase large subunit-like protein